MRVTDKILILVILSSTAAAAEEQGTSGPCSPAIAGVKGNVQVICAQRDQGGEFNKAIIDLIDGKPFSLGLPIPNYAYDRDEVETEKKIGRTHWSHDYLLSNIPARVEVFFDDSKIVDKISISGLAKDEKGRIGDATRPVLRSLYFKFVERIGRPQSSLYTDQRSNCYVPTDGLPKKLSCYEAAKNRQGAWETIDHIETDGPNRFGNLIYTYTYKHTEKGRVFGDASRLSNTECYPCLPPDYEYIELSLAK